MSIRHKAFAAAFRIIDMTGAGRLAVPFARGLGAILMFHHVRPFGGEAFAPNRILEVTPEHLDLVLGRVKALGFEIIPIGRMAQRIREGHRKRPFVVLTFDDGYVDNAVHALPVLKAHQAPFTVFATPGFADGTAPLWWLDIEEAIARQDSVTARLADGEQRFDARTPDQKRAAFDAIYWSLRRGPEQALRAEIDRLARLAGIDPLARTRALCLDWSGLRQLAAEALCTIGAHTMTHPMLAKHAEAFARLEIFDSKARLEAELQREIRHFAYPVGDPGSASEREFGFACAAGFETAVTTRPGMVFPGHADRLLSLPRLSVNGLHQSRAAIDSLLSGLPFFLLNKGRLA